MNIDGQIKDKKVQHDINRDAAKISALSWSKINKYGYIFIWKYLTGKEKLPSNQKIITERARFIYSPLEKAFEKQTKIIEDEGQN